MRIRGGGCGLVKFWILLGFLWGADVDIAALERSIETAPPAARLAAALDLMEALSDSAPQKAADYYVQFLPLLADHPDSRIGAEILTEGCWVHFAIGALDQARSICERGLAHAATDQDPELRAEFLNLLALVFETQGSRTDAFASMNQALELSTDPRMRGVIHSNAGLMLESQGAFEQALLRYQQAVEEGQAPDISESDKHYVSATAYLRMGEMNRKLGDFENAIRFQELALESGRVTGYVPDQVEALVFLSKIYQDQGNLELAQTHGQTALNTALTVEHRDLHALAKSNLALILLLRSELPSALALSEAASNDALAVGTLEAITDPISTQARILLTLERYAEALNLLAEIEATMRERNAKGELEELLLLKAQILAQQGEPKLAYDALREHHDIVGANLEARARQRLSLMQIQHEVDVRRQEVRDALQSQQLAELRSRRDRLIRNGSIGALIAGIIMLALFMSRRAQREAAEREREIQQQLKIEVESRTSQLRQEIEARQQLEADLLQSQKLDALGQLTGGIAHDFNNLMTVVMGATELVLESQDSKLTERDRESLEGALSAAESGSDITRQLLSFSRHQYLVPKPLSVGERLAGMRSLLRRTLGASIALHIEVPKEARYCAVDEAQFTTAMLNLALNARDAIEGSGEVVIRLTAVDTPPQNRLAGEFCRIDVRDNGKGMEEAVQQRALEPFFTTKDQASGTGLGLSMIYGFIRQSKGQVSIESKPGQGTTVSLWLPTIKAPETPSDEAVAPQPAESAFEAPAYRVLVVEDQPSVRQLASEMLRELGHQVVTAADGEEAREVLLTNSRFDAVLSDVVMPGSLDGRSLARWISEHEPAIKILLTSGYHEYQGDRLGYPMLSKPYTLRSLEEALSALFSSPVAPASATEDSVLT